MTKILKIFIDESGEFGFEQGSSELYVVSMVFYDTSINIDNFLHDFEDRLKSIGYTNMIHMGDLVRHKGDYKNLDIITRKKIYRSLHHFTRKLPIKICSVIINKKYTNNDKILKQQITMELNKLITKHHKYLNKFKNILVYYDNGQKLLSNIIDNVFSTLNNYEHIVEFDKIQERLFRIADMLTFIDKFNYKFKRKIPFSKNETVFFEISEIRKMLNDLESKRL